MRFAAPFAEKQTEENLMHLKDNQPVGEWRDSSNGLHPVTRGGLY